MFSSKLKAPNSPVRKILQLEKDAQTFDEEIVQTALIACE